MRRGNRVAAALGLLALLATACGGAATTGGGGTATPPSTSATPTPTPAAPRLIAVERWATAGHPATLELVDVHGHIAASHPLPTDAESQGPWVVGYGRHGVYLLSREGSLSLFADDSALRPAGSIPGAHASGDVAGVADSPDGTRRAYSVVAYANDGTATSKVYVASGTAAPHLVATLTRPNLGGAGFQGGYSVLRWDSSGLLLGSKPTGVGGAGPFIEEHYSLSTVVRMDPATGGVSPLSPSGCRFADVAADGTIACVDRTTLTVVRPDGSRTSLATYGVAVGRVAFLGSSSTLVYEVDDNLDTSRNAWAGTMYVATVGTAITPAAISPHDSVDALSETTLAFDALVDAHTVAGVTREGGSHDTTHLAYVTLFTDTSHVEQLAPADEVIGVL